jgi:DNA-binding winged helix-turn-helix (wHTH) protein/Tol biopolymer transport system component
MSENGIGLVQFGIFEVDLRAGELRRNGAKVKLQEQPFQILSLLLQHPGQVVTRDELRRQLWPADTFVDFDHSLNTAIRRLRDALGDSAENPRFVETVARRGYRFLPPIKGEVASIAPRMLSKTRSMWWLIVTAFLVLLSGATVGVLLTHRPQPRAATQQQRLTANTEEDPVLGSVISPDGKYLAFADKSGFYLRQIDNGETHPVDLPKDFHAVPSAWYPDGTHLLVTWIEGPKSPSSLWQISIMGGTPRRLIDDGRCASISRDGSQVAFLRGVNPNQELWTMGANGEDPRRRLTAPHASEFGIPAWSPTGKHLAFTVISFPPAQWGAETNIELLDLNSGSEEVLISPRTTGTELRDNAQLGRALAWTSDNHVIYSISEPPPNQGDSNLWQTPLDSNGRVAGLPTRMTMTPDDVAALTVSVDGKRVAFTKHSVNPSIYISELRAGTGEVSTPRRLTQDNWKNYPFSWTADSKAIIFVSDRDGIFHIYKQQIDQTVSELLVGGKEQANVPRLAPDNSIMYVSWPKLGEPAKPSRLMRIQIGDGRPQVVLQENGIGNLQCARPPSSVCLYHVGTPTRLSFFRLDPATGGTEELPELRIEDDAPHVYGWNLSPDGKLLVTAKTAGLHQDPSFNLYSLEDGSRRTVTLKTWAGIGGVDFAADSESLWATAYTNSGIWVLLNIDFQGHARTMLEDHEMMGWAIPSSDGKRLALWKARGSSNVWMVERF